MVHEIKACGTVRNNRKNMPNFGKTKMNCGDREFFSSDGISVIKWMDNREVLLCTNFLPPQPEEFVKRRKVGQAEKIDVKCPQIVKTYNKFMGGVDLMDQNKACYEVDRKSKIKYYLRLFFDLMDIGMNNSYVVYKKMAETTNNSSKILTSLEFRQEVARSLIADYSCRKRSAYDSPVVTKKRALVFTQPNRSTISHVPVKVDARNRCAQCSMSNLYNRSNNICQICNVTLCFTKDRDCFALYHKST